MQYLIFVFGLVIGSFLNVCIYRIPEKKSIVFPPSHCPYCQQRLKWWDLIPVLSFLLLKGRCHYCKGRLSWQYPAVELLTAGLFLTIYFKFGFTASFLAYCLLAAYLITISFIDFKYQIIPDLLSLSGIVIGIVISIFSPHLRFVNSLLGMLIGGGIIFLIAYLSQGGMGGGDLKLLALIGAFAGWKITVITIFLGALLGSIVGVIMILTGDKGLKSRLPFGPFLSLSALITIIYYNELITLYIHIFLN